MEEKVTFTKALKEGWAHYLKNLAVIIQIDLVSILPTLLLTYAFASKKTDPGVLLLWVAAIFLSLTNVGSLYTIFDRSSRNETTGFNEAFMAGVRRSFRVLCVGVIYAAISIGGLVLLIVPGIFFMMKYSFSIISSAVEDEHLSPLRSSWEFSRGNMTLIFQIALFFIALMIIPNMLSRAGAAGPPLYLLLAIPAMLISTLAQSVQFSAYKMIRDQKPQAVAADPEKKAMPVFAGCLIGFVSMIAVIAGLTIGGVYISKQIGMDKVMLKIFGDRMQVTETMALKVPAGWGMFPVNKGIKTWMVMNGKDEKEQGIIGMFLRSVPLSEPVTGILGPKSEEKAVVNTILELESSTGNTSVYWDYGTLKGSKSVKLGGQPWQKMVFESKNNNAMKEWTLYYRVTDRDLVYFYFGRPEKAGDALYDNDEGTLLKMFE